MLNGKLKVEMLKLKIGVHYKKRIKFHSVILSLDLNKEVTSPVSQQNRPVSQSRVLPLSLIHA